MLTLRQKGDFSKLTKYLLNVKNAVQKCDLDQYGKQGVAALKSATPKDTGLTADSWYYEIEHSDGRTAITFCNSNIQNGIPIAIILQYGHATRNGGWVQGRDYINPALQPIFDKIAEKAWEEVTKL
jgi:hypothetical protein